MTFIDLFAGLSGIRIGFEQAATEMGVKTHCLLTSEIKPAAIAALQRRYPNEKVDYNVYDVNATMFPDGVDVILAGFPCQPFSKAGNGLGFLDTRGTLFFEIERIIKELTDTRFKPKGFLLENVEGLINHGKKTDDSLYGPTLTTIIKKLEIAGYNVEVLLLDAADYGVAQKRKRVYILGVDASIGRVDVTNLPKKHVTFGDIQEHGLPGETSDFINRLLAHYTADELKGKVMNDKRGGQNNLHCWDLGIRGEITPDEKEVLEKLVVERRKKKWASIIGIEWKDGMPLTAQQISSFCPKNNIQEILDSLVQKGYLKYEYPRKLVHIEKDGLEGTRRVPDENKPKGYNIHTGKLSFEFSQFLHPERVTHTLVATDMARTGVIDGDSIRHLSITEGLRLFGFPEYDLSHLEQKAGGRNIAFELLGNSVCIPVIKMLALRLIQTIVAHEED